MAATSGLRGGWRPAPHGRGRRSGRRARATGPHRGRRR